MNVRTMSGVLAAALSVVVPATAQMGDGTQTVAMGAGRMVRGTVTATAADHLIIKTEAGDSYEVVLTPNTQVRKGRDPMKAADIHSGDAIGAMGEMDPAKKSVHALMVVVVDAEQVKKAREAMGKTMISGTVTAIDDLKITIKRTDDVMQTILVDEDTSFRKGGRGMGMALAADGMGGGFGGGGFGGGRGPRAAAAPAATPAAEGESVTLADIKIGNVIAGPGSIKNGIFVPTQLAISDPATQQQRRRRPEGATGTSTTTPSTTTPPTTGTEPK